MAAVLGGLGAALIWSVGITFAARAARDLGPTQTLAWVMPIGLVALAPVLAGSGPVHLSAAAAAWLALGGAGNLGGLLILYHALRIGQMGVVMPIVSTEGGLAALLAIVAGESISPIGAGALAVTVVGVVMTAIVRRPPEPRDPAPALPAPAAGAAGTPPSGRRAMAVGAPGGHGDRRAAAWALAAALSMGASLYATGRAGTLLPTAWAVLPPRLIGAVAITVPLALRGGLRRPAANARALLVAGLCEVGGFFAYASGAEHGIAVAAVLATLTGAIGVGSGRLLFGERLAGTQLAGVLIISAGVATLTAITASP